MNTPCKMYFIILTTALLSAGYNFSNEESYLSENIVSSIENISINKLLDFERIVVAIEEEFDRARFYYIIAYEIDQRMYELDEKFYTHDKKYRRRIKKYEQELHLTPYKYVDNRPKFEYEYQQAEITDYAIENEIHRIQAELARNQFIQVYKYYRRRLDNYKNYLITLRELYKCEVLQNKENKVEFFSNFPDMYQGIQLLHDAFDDEGIMHVKRDVLGRVLYIDWEVDGEDEIKRRREFEYFKDGLLSKLTDKKDNEIVFETRFGRIDLAEDFLSYIFSPGFLPRDYNYYTEVYYNNDKPSAFKITAMNGPVIGTIYREYDDKNHLFRETWCKGKTSKIMREFSSIFDAATGDYKLIERDRTGKIIHQEVVLSNND